MLRRLAYLLMRRMGWLKGHYAADLTKLRRWRKPVVKYAMSPAVQENTAAKSAVFRVLEQYGDALYPHGVTFQGTTGEDYDLHFRIEAQPDTPDGRKARGSAYVIEDADGTIRQAFVNFDTLLRHYEEFVDVGLHEAGHAIFADGHSKYEYDVMGLGREVLALTDRDKATIDEAYKA